MYHISRKEKSVAVLCSRPRQNVKLSSPFHVVVVQRRLRNVQKSVMRVPSCCFANQTHCFFAVLVAVAVVVA